MRRDGELPELLTVEEAAARPRPPPARRGGAGLVARRLLRVGRTKAYAMAKE